MSVYTVNDHQIHVEEQGPPNGPVAVLLHGWSSSWYALSPLLPYVSQRYHCFAVDLPGYGDSPPVKEAITIDGYADLIAALIQQVSPKPVVMVGHSMGGMISLTLTLRHPELVERLVLLCPTISGHLSLFINLFIAPLIVSERFPLARGIALLFEPQFLRITDRLMRPSSFAEHTGVTEQDYKRLRADVRRRGQGRVRADCFWAMRRGDLRGKLRKIDTPALVIWGMEDNTVPLRDASVIAEEMPDADLRIIPRASHWPQFEAPEITQRYVRAFLNTPAKLLTLEF